MRTVNTYIKYEPLLNSDIIYLYLYFGQFVVFMCLPFETKLAV